MKYQVFSPNKFFPKEITGCFRYIVVILLLISSSLTASTYYVDGSTGNNGNAGSKSNPWATIQHAVDVVSAGDTVFIRGGTYAERVMLTGTTGSEGNSGSATAGYISYQGYPEETVILDGSSFSWGCAFMSGKWAPGNRAMHHIRIANLTVRNYPEQGIAFEGSQESADNSIGSHHIIIENVISHDNGGPGIWFEGGDESGGQEGHDIVVRGCEAYNNTGHGIKFDGDVAGTLNREHIRDSVIEDCIIHDNTTIGIHISTGHYNITVRNNSAYNNGKTGLAGHEIWDSVFENNICYSNGYGGYDTKDGIVIWSSKNVILRQNKIYDNAGWGILYDSELDGSPSVPTVEYNVIYANNSGGLALYYVRNGKVINNTLASNQGPGLSVHSSAIGHTSKNNILYQNSPQVSAGTSEFSSDYNLYDPQATFEGQGAHSVTSPPAFTDPTAGDYSLQANSPAIDAGYSVALTASVDAKNTPVPQGPAPDLGAYEFLPASDAGYGDVDSNGIIETFDASLTLQYSIAIDPLPDTDPRPWSPARIHRADVDENGEVQAFDSALIQQFVIGNLDSLPAGQSRYTVNTNSPKSTMGAVTQTSDSILSFIQSGDEIIISATQLSDVFGINLTILYPVEAVTFTEAQIMDSGEEYIMQQFTPEPGHLNIGMMSPEPPSAGGPLLAVPFLLANGPVDLQINYIVNAGDTMSQNLSLIPQTTDYSQQNTPKENRVYSNYPNPFNSETTIPYSVQSRDRVSIRIFDVTGALVSTLVDHLQDAGNYDIRWPGTDTAGQPVPTGMYLVRLSIGSHFDAISRILLIK